MPVYTAGQKVNETEWSRLIQSIGGSYTIHAISTTIYAESLTDSGTDYSGTLNTDDATVFQNAIDSVETQGGGDIYCRKADYDIGTTGLTIDADNVQLIMERGASLTYSGTGTAITIGDGSAFTDNVGLINLIVYATSSAQVVKIYGTRYTRINWCDLLGDEADGHGILFNTLNTSGIGNLYDRVTQTRCRAFKGIKITGSAGEKSNANQILSGFMRNTTGNPANSIGIEVDNGEQNVVWQTDIEGFETGMTINDSGTIASPRIEDGTTGVDITGGSNSVILYPPYIGATTAVSDSGTDTKIHSRHWITENHGTATIGNGTQTTGNIAHGLSAEPTVVFALGSTTDTEDLYCSSKDATNIVIQTAVGAVGGDRTIYWHARV